MLLSSVRPSTSPIFLSPAQIYACRCHSHFSYNRAYRSMMLRFIIFDTRALWRSELSVRVPGCQKLQTRSGTGCFMTVPIWQQWASKG